MRAVTIFLPFIFMLFAGLFHAPFAGVFGGQVFAQDMAQDTPQGFLSAAPDIPLAPTMKENLAQALIFDKAEGRIVTMEAVFEGEASAILDFYRAVLPNLGWQSPTDGWERPGRLTFARGHETLTIRTQTARVIFTLRPL